jgi:hypothetical protein
MSVMDRRAIFPASGGKKSHVGGNDMCMTGEFWDMSINAMEAFGVSWEMRFKNEW